jgi:hypothetical protein
MMWTPQFGEADQRRVIKESSRMSAEAAGALLFDQAMQDWRDVLPLITEPVLMIAAEASMFAVDGIKKPPLICREHPWSSCRPANGEAIWHI